MSIPLNIDTPTGTEFTVNKAIRVDSSGRISLSIIAEKLEARAQGDQVKVKHLNSKTEISITLPAYAAESYAYQILGAVTETKRYLEQKKKEVNRE